MTGAIAHDEAQHLRTALSEALRSSPGLPATAREAFKRLVDVLESSEDAVVFPANATVSTQEAGTLLGLSRMTVVRLIDRGELRSVGGAVHRRIAVSEVARYQADSAERRRKAMTKLAEDINESTPPDRVIDTR